MVRWDLGKKPESGMPGSRAGTRFRTPASLPPAAVLPAAGKNPVGTVVVVRRADRTGVPPAAVPILAPLASRLPAATPALAAGVKAAVLADAGLSKVVLAIPGLRPPVASAAEFNRPVLRLAVPKLPVT